MAVVMWVLGFLPLFALMLVPARVGEIKRERLTGAEAQEHFEAKLSQDPNRMAAYQKAVARLKAKGKTRSSIVVSRAYSEEVEQTALRRIAEAFVPTLYARQYYAETIWDDWSGYDPQFDGTHYTYDGGYREAQLLISFNKDPETNFATALSEIIWYSGWEPDLAPAPEQVAGNQKPGLTFHTAVYRVADRIVQAAYPTLCAEKLQKSWWDRFGDWAECTVVGCSGAAAGCWIANVWNAEAGWAPCFIAGCGGAEVGCAVYAILQ